MKGIVRTREEFDKYREFESKSVKLIDVDLIKDIDLSEFELLIIPAEIISSQKKKSDFYGFEILRDLRIKLKLTIPIIIHSVLPRSILLNNYSQLGCQALLTSGHYFFEYPFDLKEALNGDYEGVDEDTLNDINNTVFTLDGVLNEEFHDLKNKAFKESYNNETIEELFTELLQDIESSFSKFEKIFNLTNNESLYDIKKRLISDLNESINETKSFDESIVIINNYIGEVKRLLPPDKIHKTDYALIHRPPWEVLFVDDVPSIAREVQRMFFEKSMICHIANNGEEAFKILKGDKQNKITILICDYRLMDEDGTWHKWQGYNILKEVFLNFDNELAFFALTSFNKRALLRMQDTHKMRVRTASKDDVIGKSHTVTGFNLFAEQVLEEGNKVFDLYRSQPKVTSWVKGYSKKFDRPLRAYYRIHRLSKDVDVAEEFISSESETFYEAIRRSKHDEGPAIYPENLPIQEGIGIDKKLELTEKEKLEKFRIKLTGRRVAIALFDQLEMTKGQIYSAMKSGVFRKKEPTESPNTINQFFSTFLALSLEKDIPKNLLPEEKIWLEQIAIK